MSDGIQTEYGLFIGGAFTEVGRGRTIEVFNPATRDLLARVACAERADVDAAVACAQQAFRSWKSSTRGARAKALNEIAAIIEANIEHLARVETLDTGKCYGEAVLHQRASIDVYRYFAGCILAHEDSCVRHDNGSVSLISREPLGVVGLLLPWNAPSMLLSWKLAPALAAGNCVVIKPASAAPLAVLETIRLCKDVVPAGVVNVLCGSGGTVGNGIVQHPGIAKISFTGSTAVGAGIAQVTGGNIVPCTLELGGKSANIIFADANIERATQFAALAILGSAGAICVSGSRLFVQEEVYDGVVPKLVSMFEKVRVGDPMRPDVQMGPIIDETQMNTILAYIEAGRTEGARLLCGGRRLSGGAFDKGCFIAPTIFEVGNRMKIAQEEIFGPVLVVQKFRDEAEVVELANDTVYGLGAGIWTRDMGRVLRVGGALDAGTVWVNDYLSVSPGGPFGGYKKSGIGREVHKVALDHYSRIKNLCLCMSEDVPPLF
jgi:aldehyde dehydrogenase (NAD+)